MKPLVVSIMFALSAAPLFSQDERIDSLLNEVFGADYEMLQVLDPSLSFWYLYGGAAADNKTFYAGREIGEGMYNVRGNIYFFHSRGFFIGASGSWYSQLEPAYRTTILSAGISTPLNQKRSLTFRVFYNRYFYNDTDVETESVFKNNIGTGLSIRNNWIGARFSINALFGKEFGANIITGIFSNIPLVRFGDYNSLKLRPEASLLMGSEKVEYENAANLSGQQQEAQPPTLTANDVYGLLNAQLYFPICLYLGDFDCELGYTVNIPFSQDEDAEYPVNSFFSFSLGYMLPLD